jgi:curved DNA-binding protein CbpA
MSRSIEQAAAVLRVAADSDPATVAHAYGRLARATHPDVSGDPDAAQRFATVAAAYRLLADHARRQPPDVSPRAAQTPGQIARPAANPPNRPPLRPRQATARVEQLHSGVPQTPRLADQPRLGFVQGGPW